MSSVLKVDKITSLVLSHRGVLSKNSAISFINPKLTYMEDYDSICDIDRAFHALSLALDRRDKIVIYGDYDVDGVMSCVILYKLLRLLKANVMYYIPDRHEEGYGLNKGAIFKLKEEHMVDLIIVCDNGISAKEEALYIKALDMKLIIIDHHEPSFIFDDEGNKVSILPLAEAIVDPKRNDCNYRFKHLCAAGLAYKFAKYTLDMFNKDKNVLDEFLVLSSIATVCDAVSLTGENRIMVKCGLKLLNNRKDINKGLYELIKANGIEGNITNYHIGFVIGPCINASGRLMSAMLAAELFLADKEQVIGLAQKVTDLNKKRKELTALYTTRVFNRVREGNLDKDKVIIIVDKDMHESIAGIIAGRLKDKLYKPVIILTKAMSGLKGSGRSIPEYNMYDELYRVKNLLVKFGGHAMAAGLSIEEDNVNQLRTVLNKNCSLCSEDFLETLKIDCSLEFKNISLYLAYELCLIEPYGTNNPEPLFVSRGVYISTIRIMEHKNTIIFNFKDSEGMELKGICFNLVDVFKDRFISTYGQNEFNLISKSIISKVYSMDIVYTINLNTYRKAEAQLNIRDFKFY